MRLSTINKYELVLHDLPMCAICNKPVEKAKKVKKAPAKKK